MNTFQIANVRYLLKSALTEGALLIADGKIQAFLHEPLDLPTMDGQGAIVLPGLIDIHMHGCAGVDVNAADQAGYDTISAFLASQGCTAFQCSILTDTKEQTLWCIRQALQAMRRPLPGAQLVGIHLEGPFLSPQYKGAMPESLLQTGNAELFRQYQNAAEGNIRYMTVSPEVPGVLSLIKQIKDSVVLALGHSGADYETARQAVQLGASCFTHTGNAMRLIHQHEPGVLGAALESSAYCEAICDGRHLHPGFVRMLLACKGYGKVIAITDSIMAAGLPDGQYKLGVHDVTVKNGDARLTISDVRAGSTLTPLKGLQNVLSFTGEPIEKVIPIFTCNPAALLHLQTKGTIAPGMDADLILVNEEAQLLTTFVQGRLVYHNT